GVDPADRLIWTNTVGNVPPQLGQKQPYTQNLYDGFGQLAKRDRVDLPQTSGTGKPGVRQVLDFLWDSDGRLRQINNSGVNATGSIFTATYDVDGERITQWEPQTGNHTY